MRSTDTPRPTVSSSATHSTASPTTSRAPITKAPRVTTNRDQPTDLIFPGPDGSPWNLDRVNNWRGRIFAEATKAAGIPGIRPYDLRHSYISLLIAQGANGRRSRPTGGTQPDDGAQHIRPPVRRARPKRSTLNAQRSTLTRRPDHSRSRGATCPRSVRFVSARNRPTRHGPRKSLENCHGRSRTRTWDLFLIREAL